MAQRILSKLLPFTYILSRKVPLMSRHAWNMVSSPATAGPFMSNLQAKTRDRTMRIMGEKERGEGTGMREKRKRILREDWSRDVVSGSASSLDEYIALNNTGVALQLHSVEKI